MLLAAVLAGILATACSGEPDATDGLDRIGTTRSGATVYAARHGTDRVSVVVLVGADTWCNASGRAGTDPRTSIALCNDTTPDGSTYVEPVAKDAEPRPVCDQRSGAPAALERVMTPQAWDFDLVVSLTSEQAVFLTRCARL